jgi:autotransporter-associated beta strand protein
MMDFNVVSGVGAQIDSFTTGNWGDYLNFSGGGSITVLGNLSNTSDGSAILTVNNGTTVTLQGETVKVGTGDAYRYIVENGTLVADNSLALINDTLGAGASQSLFIVGPATNIVAAASGLPTGFQTVNTNNSVNCAFYLGDTNNPNGGLTTPANLTNYVSDGDIGFTNNGTITIGGQNTNGDNIYANPIILGWTANRGKSVTLVAATGGEVDFANILANGTDQTAGVTVNDAAHQGLVEFTGVNTYGGNTTVNGGTLEVANANFSTNSTVTVTNGATLQLNFAGVNVVNALVLNGVSKPPGTFNSGNTTYITGSGSLQVVVTTPPPPVARFSGSPTNIFVSQTVTFTDASTGSITNWVWNFGDGNSVTNSSNASVNHIYNATNTYTVSLTVNGTGGSSLATSNNYIVVKPKVAIGKPVLSGGSLILSGVNGPAGQQYRILTSTNVALPLVSWTPVYTNMFNSDGSFGYTNTPLTGKAGFLILVSP